MQNVGFHKIESIVTNSMSVELATQNILILAKKNKVYCFYCACTLHDLTHHSLPFLHGLYHSIAVFYLRRLITLVHDCKHYYDNGGWTKRLSFFKLFASVSPLHHLTNFYYQCTVKQCFSFFVQPNIMV